MGADGGWLGLKDEFKQNFPLKYLSFSLGSFNLYIYFLFPETELFFSAVYLQASYQFTRTLKVL